MLTCPQESTAERRKTLQNAMAEAFAGDSTHVDLTHTSFQQLAHKDPNLKRVMKFQFADYYPRKTRMR